MLGAAALVCAALPWLTSSDTVAAQTVRTSQSASRGMSANADAQTMSRAPERVSAQNLTVHGFQFNSLMLNNEAYRFNGATNFFSSDGRRLTMPEIKPGQVVDIIYLTGGTRTETYPYYAHEKVLSSVRVVAGAQQR